MYLRSSRLRPFGLEELNTFLIYFSTRFWNFLTCPLNFFQRCFFPKFLKVLLIIHIYFLSLYISNYVFTKIHDVYSTQYIWINSRHTQMKQQYNYIYIQITLLPNCFSIIKSLFRVLTINDINYLPNIKIKNDLQIN